VEGAPRGETDDPALDGPPLEQDATTAGRASEADVRAQPIDGPLGAAARMRAAEPQDVTDAELEHRVLHAA
jgi:hypothetical protein